MELSKLSWSIRGTLGRKLLKKSLQYTGVVEFFAGFYPGLGTALSIAGVRYLVSWCKTKCKQ